ncbi:histidine kinase dimerization/phosphoacceptor domain-containing protein [Cryptosporangium minutisporangium]|uniref:histidine kinase n=1 Tax=Cryptosporangium minutisporangium TaxID=113569 RepID=A0ABP6SQQ5_9ACTN
MIFHIVVGIVSESAVRVAAAEVIMGVLTFFSAVAASSGLDGLRPSGSRSRQHSAAVAVDAERRRVARELHDVIGHHLAVIGLQARRFAADERSGSAARNIDELARLAAEDLRRMVRPPADREGDEPGPA